MKTKKDFTYDPDKSQTTIYKDPETGIFRSIFMIKGRRYHLSSGVKDAKSAADILYKRYLDAYKTSDTPKTKAAPKSKIPTVKDCVDLFLLEIVAYSGQTVSQTSANGYVNALKRLVAAKDDKSIDTLKLDQFTPEYLRLRRQKRYADRKLNIEKDKDLILNNSINSEIENALSVFSETALSLYESHGFTIPQNIHALKKERPLPAKKPNFEPLAADIDELMIKLANAALDDSVELENKHKSRIPTPQVAVIYELARFCSLTCKEIQNIRWSWIDFDGGRITIAGNREFSTKRNSKDRIIPVASERVKRWKHALGGKKDDYVINHELLTPRLDITQREANAWIKSFYGKKETRHKGLHELRKMATSDFLRATNGDVFKVSQIIGDDPRTMLKYYAAVLDLDVKPL